MTMHQLYLPLDDDTTQSGNAEAGVVLCTDEHAPVFNDDVHHTASPVKRYTFRGGYCGRTALYRHQAVGVSTIANRTALLLADEQGLGKTLQGLYAQCVRMKRKELYGAVIICYQRHVHIWEENIREHEPRILPMLQVLAGLPPDKRVYDHGKRFWIVNYEILARTPRRGQPRFLLDGPATLRGMHTNEDVRRLVQLCAAKKVSLLCDEVHALRNPQSRTFRVVTNIGARAEARYGLTGTPVAERSWDLWAQAFYLDHGYTLGKSYAAYLSRYAVVRETRYGTMPIRGKNLGELNERIRGLVLRRLKKDCLDLPKKTIRYVPAFLEGKDRARAKEITDALLVALGEAINQFGDLNLAAAGVSIKSPLHDQISTLMARMALLTTMPCLVDPSLSKGVKYELTRDVFEQASCPVIVWCKHRAVTKAYADALNADGYKVGMISGDVKQPARVPIINDFKQGKLAGMICTLATMSMGETLVKSHHCVYVQRDYNRLFWNQSQDRVDRIGQTVPVTLDVLVSDLGMDLHHGCVLSNKDDEADTVVEAARRNDYDIASASSLRDLLKRGVNDFHSIVGEW